MKRLKTLIFSLFTILLLVAGALWLTANLIPTDRIKTFLSNQITHYAGQQSYIDGELHWQLFPGPALRITKLHIGDTKTATNYAVFIDTLIFKIQFMPLLRGEFVIRELTIDKLIAKISPDIHPKSMPANTNKPATTHSIDKYHAPMTFAIKQFLLTNGQVIIADKHQEIVLQDLQLGANKLNVANQPFPLLIKGNLQASTDKHIVRSNVHFKGKVSVPTRVFSITTSALTDAFLEGQMQLENTMFDNVRIKTVNTSTKFANGHLTLDPLNINLYDGESVGNAAFNIQNKVFSFNQTAMNLNGEELFNAMLKHKTLTGKLDASIHASGTLTEENWQEHLKLNGSVTVKNGVLYTIDITTLMNDILGRIKRVLQVDDYKAKIITFFQDFDPKKYQAGKTPFQLLSVQYNLEKGMKLSDAIILQTQGLQLKGHGYIDLNNYAINNDIFVIINTSNQQVNTIQELFTNGFPLQLTGTLTQPILIPNLQNIIPIISRYWLKKTFDKPMKNLQEQLNDWIS